MIVQTFVAVCGNALIGFLWRVWKKSVKELLLTLLNQGAPIADCQQSFNATKESQLSKLAALCSYVNFSYARFQASLDALSESRETSALLVNAREFWLHVTAVDASKHLLKLSHSRSAEWLIQNTSGSRRKLKCGFNPALGSKKKDCNIKYYSEQKNKVKGTEMNCTDKSSRRWSSILITFQC